MSLWYDGDDNKSMKTLVLITVNSDDKYMNK